MTPHGFKRTPKGLLIALLSQEDYRQHDEAYDGLCLGCGTWHGGVEPDARKYHCDNCGENRVYGLEECVLLGRIEFT